MEPLQKNLKHIAQAISSPTAIWIVGVAISVFLFFDQELLSRVAGHFGHAGLLVVASILPGGILLSACAALVRLCPSISFVRVVGITSIPLIGAWLIIQVNDKFPFGYEILATDNILVEIVRGIFAGLVFSLFLHLWLLIPKLIVARVEFRWRWSFTSMIAIGFFSAFAYWLEMELEPWVLLIVLPLNASAIFARAADKNILCVKPKDG
jgi:hypothetical protein